MWRTWIIVTAQYVSQGTIGAPYSSECHWPLLSYWLIAAHDSLSCVSVRMFRVRTPKKRDHEVWSLKIAGQRLAIRTSPPLCAVQVTRNPTNGGKPCPVTLIETQGGFRACFWRAALGRCVGTGLPPWWVRTTPTRHLGVGSY